MRLQVTPWHKDKFLRCLMNHNPKYQDLTGRRFGRLVCQSFAGSDENGMARWNVRCDCGTAFVVYRINLLSGGTKSCGCWKKEQLTIRNYGRKTRIEI